MTVPLVSVIIPLYNSEKYIAETLDSVLDQTYPHWECIIIDDGSVDNSRIIVQDYCKRDNRFKYHYQPNSGPSASRNLGLVLSKGTYVQYLDSDDIITKERFEILIKEYTSTRPDTILYTDLRLGEDKNIRRTSRMNLPSSIGKDIHFEEMYRYFAWKFLIIPSCLFFPRNALTSIHWDEKMRNSEDWDFYLKVLKKNFLFKYYDSPLVIYRNTYQSLSKDKRLTYKSLYKVLIETAIIENNYSFLMAFRISLFIKKNLMHYLLKKSSHIYLPDFSLYKNSPRLIISQVVIVPITIYLFLIELLNISFQKLSLVNIKIKD